MVFSYQSLAVSISSPKVSLQHRGVSVAYLLLLILHRHPVGEHRGLIDILNQHANEMEVDTMAEAIAGTLLEQGIEQGIEQGETRAKRACDRPRLGNQSKIHAKWLSRHGEHR